MKKITINKMPLIPTLRVTPALTNVIFTKKIQLKLIQDKLTRLKLLEPF